jgi:hypothetical protein
MMFGVLFFDLFVTPQDVGAFARLLTSASVGIILYVVLVLILMPSEISDLKKVLFEILRGRDKK